MYKHARILPRRGFLTGGYAGKIDNGPTERFREAKAAYENKIAEERRRSAQIQLARRERKTTSP